MHQDCQCVNARCCWIDLAAIDTSAATWFYHRLFGWKSRSIRANGGEITEFTANGESVASMYRLSSAQITRGVPQHWTPYVGVADIDVVAARAARLGGAVIVQPFDVDGVARVSLIADSGNALLGLWESSA